jgi:hypothetical protein
MALQGSLRDFSVTEILQLLGTQKKTGCLLMEWNTERAMVFIHDGRIVSTRDSGVKLDDTLLRFLRKIHRLSEDQCRGIQSIQKESGRDLEDLLLNGRYLEPDELKGYIERQILDDLMRLVRWESGNYRFDPKTRWNNSPLVRMNVEGALIEAARRVDEHKRFVARFKDPYELLGVRDLPDPDEPLTEEERELFGIIDGNHTVADVVEAAPLLEYEAYEALNRMLEENWIENVGRRDPGIDAILEQPTPTLRRTPILNEFVIVVLIVAVVLGLRYGANLFGPASAAAPPRDDVYTATQMRDLRFALDLYKREHGIYPRQLTMLVDEQWLSAEQVALRGYRLSYRLLDQGAEYQLELLPSR